MINILFIILLKSYIIIIFILKLMKITHIKFLYYYFLKLILKLKRLKNIITLNLYYHNKTILFM